ncbi:MAG: helix-turn-helix domain-containing protein [Fodinibius sp.]|nr:helix-turn-helix domain-containing protein [Fodinibius sp.]
MGTEERRKREQQRRRNQIIDAAEAVIERNGFRQATMDEIAEEAELSKGTLYLYFSQKTALYLAISKKGLQQLNDKFIGVMQEDKSGIELLQRLGETFLSYITTHPEYSKAMIYYESLVDEEQIDDEELAEDCEEIGRKLLMYLTRAIQIGMQDGSIVKQMDPKLLAVQIWGSMRGMMQLYQVRSQRHLQKILQDFELDMETMIRQFLDVHIKGIQNHE